MAQSTRVEWGDRASIHLHLQLAGSRRNCSGGDVQVDPVNQPAPGTVAVLHPKPGRAPLPDPPAEVPRWEGCAIYVRGLYKLLTLLAAP